MPSHTLSSESVKPPKLLYFVNSDWFFYSHFLDRAIAAREAGYEVVVLTHITRADDRLDKLGIRLVGVELNRSSLNPFQILRNLVDVYRVYQAEKPDISHQIALLPILLGSIACRFLGFKRVVNAFVGLGFAFSSDRLSARLVRRVLPLLFSLVLDKKHAKTVFENGDDLDYFVTHGWVRQENAVLIRGAGVDVKRFRPLKHRPFWVDESAVHEGSDAEEGDDSSLGSCSPHNPPVIVLLARMLWDKGIGEFVKAAAKLCDQHGDAYARFVLVGDTDSGNRGAISREQLQEWKQQGVVEWWGHQSDVRATLAQASISCLPSYREGLPKSLLESMAMGVPCIATDVPGCREAVIDGVNGLLVPARDADALASAITRLVANPRLCQKFGQASRQMAQEQFAVEIVNRQTLELYRRVLGAG